jgi:hypothetical protein
VAEREGFEQVRGINACDLADSPTRQLRTDPQPRGHREAASPFWISEATNAEAKDFERVATTPK